MYDKEKIYDEQIAPLMQKIIEICQANDVQMLASYYLRKETDDEYDLYCSTCLIPKGGSKTLINATNVLLNKYTVEKPLLMAVTVTKG